MPAWVDRRVGISQDKPEACQFSIASIIVAVFVPYSVTIAALAPASLRLFATLKSTRWVHVPSEARGPAFLGIKMTTVQSFTASVNESSLLKKLGLLFASSDSFISEALQNARRAEATEIKVKFGDDSLQIIDNGNGIEDFSKLFVFCESGWADKIQAADNPYGMGVFSYFFAANKVTFESHGNKVVVNSDSFLDGSPTEHETSDVTTGTVVTFEGLKFNKDMLQSALAPMVKGFPVPVFEWATEKYPKEGEETNFEWKELPRPHALSSEFSAASVGMVKTELTSQNQIYLQGLRISGDGYLGNIVHLDSTQFKAVMPDRKMLFDSTVQLARIAAAVQALQIEQIKAARAVMTTKEFVKKYYCFLRHSGAESLLDDVDYIGSEQLDYVTADLQNPRATYQGSLTKESVSNVVLVKNLPDMDDHPFSAMMHCVMEEAGWLALNVGVESHWAVKEAVDFVGLQFDVTTSGQERESSVNGVALKVYDTVSVRVYNNDGFDVTIEMNSFIIKSVTSADDEHFDLDCDVEVIAPLGCFDTPVYALSTYMFGEYHQQEDEDARDADAALWLATLQKLNGTCDFFKNLERTLNTATQIVSQSVNEMALVVSAQNYCGTKCVKLDEDWFAKVAKECGADPEKLKLSFISTIGE